MAVDLGEERAANLRVAQRKAAALFDCVESRGLIRAGATEKSISNDIYALAEEMFGITTYWHKRIVRAGKNTLAPYALDPPNLTIGADDIVFLDFGPVFEKWEADFGRTFVVGSDPLKIRMRDDVASAFAEGKAYFNASRDVTASELFGYASDLAKNYVWSSAVRWRAI